MRGLVAVLAGIVASAALAATLVYGWVAQHVADEDGFVELAQSLTTSTEVRDSLNEVLAQRLVDAVDVPAATAEQVTRLVSQATDRALAEPDVEQAWQESLRRTHAAVLDGDADGQIPLELAPLAELVAQRTDGLVQAPSTLTVDLRGGPSAEAVETVNDSPGLARGAAIVALVAAVVSLLAARRRGRALAGLGVGAVLAAGAVALVARLVQDRAGAEATAQSGLSAQGQLTRALLDVAVTSMDRWLLWTAIAGGVALVPGLVASAVRRS